MISSETNNTLQHKRDLLSLEIFPEILNAIFQALHLHLQLWKKSHIPMKWYHLYQSNNLNKNEELLENGFLTRVVSFRAHKNLFQSIKVVIE